MCNLADTNGSARRPSAVPKRSSAFTLTEMLVVMTIVVVLMAFILPSIRKSMRQAKSTVCRSNLKDLFISLYTYQSENNGWLPTVDSAAAMRSTEAWTSRLFDNNPAGCAVLVCPDDPWATIIRANLAVNALKTTENASYGLNDFIASSPSSFLANLERFEPQRPDDTILVADMGPDTVPAPSTEDEDVIRGPSRNAGRLSIDDGYRPGDPPHLVDEPWLVGRHMGRINVLTLMGNVKSVKTEPALSRPVEPYYPACAENDCTLCVYLELPHYSFVESGAFWWTGSVPLP